uniref:hypothetical protein n=1 Tax=Thaumasiovibrio occultus TaxID=1891184 RepID=UPI000B35E8F2|nr:hypothetical protein [Thaumasiovibrio occultus]
MMSDSTTSTASKHFSDTLKHDYLHLLTNNHYSVHDVHLYEEGLYDAAKHLGHPLNHRQRFNRMSLFTRVAMALFPAILPAVLLLLLSYFVGDGFDWVLFKMSLAASAVLGLAIWMQCSDWVDHYCFGEAYLAIKNHQNIPPVVYKICSGICVLVGVVAMGFGFNTGDGMVILIFLIVLVFSIFIAISIKETGKPTYYIVPYNSVLALQLNFDSTKLRLIEYRTECIHSRPKQVFQQENDLLLRFPSANIDAVVAELKKRVGAELTVYVDEEYGDEAFYQHYIFDIRRQLREQFPLVETLAMDDKQR